MAWVLACIPLALALCAGSAARAADIPAWLYPGRSTSPLAPSVDDAKVVHLKGSELTFTRAQLKDMFSAPDWYPNDHGAMPAIVSHGNPPKVFACGFCHSPTGQGRPENASLAGLPAAYISQQVADFKSGARKSAWHGTFLPTDLMIRVAQNSTQEETDVAAEYFAAQVLLPRVTVIERVMVPKTHMNAFVFVADAGTGREPLAGRILELAPDLARHDMRDDHLRYVAYVPKGSIARGASLARNGVPKVAPACVACHGPELRGIGIAPPIAGRSPSYLLRQLLAFQTGARAGVGAAIMRPNVAKFELDDLVALAAYAASLPSQ
jgi:cytochrome c553